MPITQYIPESFEAASEEYEPCVRDLMTDDVFTLYEDDNLNMLDDLMRWRRIRHVPVIDDEGVLVGLVTHRDFLKAAVSALAEMEQGKVRNIYREIPVKSIMTDEVLSVSEDTPLAKAAELMVENKYGCLPVVGEDGVLVGIITEADYVKAFSDWDVAFKD